jgi:serine/threonine protein kinase
MRIIKFIMDSSYWMNHTIIEKIGEGTQGIIFLIKKNEKNYVLKSYKYEDSYIKESNAFKLINNTSEYTPQCFYMEKNIVIMEYYDGYIPFKKYIDSFFDKYASSDIEDNYQKREIIEFLKNIEKIRDQLLNAISNLRDINIVHNDLNSSNILIDEKTLSIKIIDFGSSKIDQISFINRDYEWLGDLFTDVLIYYYNSESIRSFIIPIVEKMDERPRNRFRF